MENFTWSTKPPVASHASSPNLPETGCSAVSGFASARPSTDGVRCTRPHSPPAKLDSEKFGNSAVGKTCWLDWIMNRDGGSSSSYIIMIFLCNMANSWGGGIQQLYGDSYCPPCCLFEPVDTFLRSIWMSQSVVKASSQNPSFSSPSTSEFPRDIHSSSSKSES